MVSVAGADITQIIKDVIKTPSKFYKSVKNEKGYKKPFAYYAVLSVLYGIFSALLFVLIGTEILATLGISLFQFITGLVGIFIGAALSHIFVYILGGRKGYLQTFKAVVYSSTPSLLFGWIPLAGLLAILYDGFYLYPKGLSMLHEISFLRALTAVLLPVALIILIFLLSFGF
jgi:hypothetical protein